MVTYSQAAEGEAAPTQPPEHHSERRIAGRAQALPVLLANTLPVLGVVALTPNLPTFYAHFAGVPNAKLLVPLLLVIPGFCNVALSWLTGIAADRWGRRRLLLLATLTQGVFGMVPLVLEDLRWILATRVMVGVAESVLWTAASALVGDYFQGAERRKWLALQDGVAPILQTIVIIGAGALGSINWHLPFAIYSVSLTCSAWLFVSTWEPESVRAPDEHHRKAPFPWRTAALVGSVTLFTAIIFFVQVLQLGVIFAKLGAANSLVIGIGIAVASIGVILGAFVYRRLSRAHVGILLALVYLLDGLSYVSFVFLPGYQMAVLVATFSQVASGITMPSLVNWALMKFDVEVRGRGMGIWTSCLFLGQFVSQLVVTAATTVTGNILRAVAIIGAVSLAASVLALIAGIKKNRGVVKANG